LVGLASQFIRFRDKVNEIYDEYNPTITTNLIEEWETVVGIPDGCIGNTGTLVCKTWDGSVLSLVSASGFLPGIFTAVSASSTANNVVALR
jgi:hypothetical protein